MIIRSHSFRPNNSVALLESGEPYFSKLEQLIREAKYSIHLQVYIFTLDITGRRILDMLKEAAQRGVEVYLVVDAYASKDFNSKTVNALQALPNMWVKTFAPLHLQQLRIGRRLHHKIVLVDEQTALVGGINIADNYSGFHGKTPWFDIAVLTQGHVAYDLKKICSSIWPKRIQKKWKKHQHISIVSDSQVKLRVLQNDWWRRRTELSSAYNGVIRNAEKELTIVSSYFLPGFTKRRLLKKAAERGVNITLITGNDSDIPFMTAAVKYLYSVLLRNNITIYEWKKSVLHAKMAVADGIWSTVGSYNLNALSDYGSLEANIEITDETFAKDTQAFLQTIIQTGCEKVDPDEFVHSTTWLKRIFRWTSYKLLRALLFILFALMRRDKIKRS